VTNLLTAHHQWASRPADERFQTFDQLETAVAGRRISSTPATWLSAGLHFRETSSGDLVVAGGQVYEGARFSNWSFRQTAGLLGAPADFVAGLPTRVAADVLNVQACRRKRDEGRVQVLLQDRPGDRPMLRAVTSEKYSRAIWDIDVVRMVRQLVDGTSFRNPLAFAAGEFGGREEPGGLYASDRDCFITVWDQEHPVEVDGELLFRFALFWNSETGARTFGATLGLVRTICRNLILWGARDLVDIRLRHVGAIDERIKEEIPRILDALGQTDPTRERDVIRAALRKQIAKNDDEAVTFLTENGFTRRVAREAVGMAVLEEGGAGSLWQIVQGVTAHARSIPHRDQRAVLERQAGRLLELAA